MLVRARTFPRGSHRYPRRRRALAPHRSRRARRAPSPAGGGAGRRALRRGLFSLNRAPGGTFGNRNFMAHLCVIVFPALLVTTLRSRTPRSFGWWTFGIAAVMGALVLSRSRAAWLGLIAGAIVLALFA